VKARFQTFGAMVKSPSGYPIQSPYIAIANRQAEIMMRIASEFGFRVICRPHVDAPGPGRSGKRCIFWKLAWMAARWKRRCRALGSLAASSPCARPGLIAPGLTPGSF
jgi:hypothetical protein